MKKEENSQVFYGKPQQSVAMQLFGTFSTLIFAGLALSYAIHEESTVALAISVLLGIMFVGFAILIPLMRLRYFNYLEVDRRGFTLKTCLKTTYTKFEDIVSFRNFAFRGASSKLSTVGWTVRNPSKLAKLTEKSSGIHGMSPYCYGVKTDEIVKILEAKRIAAMRTPIGNIPG